MNSLRSNRFAVLMSLVATLAISNWVAGCAGFAEPLPTLSATPNNVSVTAAVGATGSQVVTLANTGTTNVVITQATLTGAGFTTSGLTAPMGVAAGGTQNFMVKFSSSAVTTANGTIVLVTDAAHRPITVQLKGQSTSTTSPVSSVTIAPGSTSVATSGKFQFTASVQGTSSNTNVNWSASTGTITPYGLFTAPAASGVAQVTATSVADPTKSAVAIVTVTSTATPSAGASVSSVTITPSTATSALGGTLSFGATVVGTTTNKSVTWSAVRGRITSAGVYTAPATAVVDTVTATSNEDPTKSAVATVTVTSTPSTGAAVSSVTVTPSTANSATGGTLPFSATVAGSTTKKSVTWSALHGKITAEGIYTAPAAAVVDKVTATSVADSTKSGSATVSVTKPTPTPAPTPTPTPAPTSGTQCAGNCPAFPEAGGGGAATTGGSGRGGTSTASVYEVTNLNDSGSGSLRVCLEAAGPRTCVFRVNGLITFTSRMQISNPYVTIAGQTAPGEVVIGGLNQQGEQIFVSTHDVIVRYITYDGNNPNTPTGPDTGTVCCEMASGDVHDIIWDHMSVRWTGNKAFPVVSNQPGEGIHNTTIQWTLLYEPNLTHSVGIGTAYVSSGSGMATTNNDAHHNAFINVDHRLPLNQSGRNVRWVNNLIYNWGQFGALSMGGLQIDYIGNKYVDGSGGNLNYSDVHVFLANGNGCDPNDQVGDCPNGDNERNPTFYLLNNIGHAGNKHGGPMVSPTHSVNDAGQLSMTQQGWEGGDTGDSNSQGPWPSSWVRSSPLPAQAFPIAADAVENLDNVMLPTVGNSQHLACDGTWVSHRNSQDARVINQYKSNASGNLFTGQYNSPSISSGTPCSESIHDGIPDQWKTKYSLSTSDGGLGSRVATNGYTYLENYLNGTDPTK